MLLGTYLGVCGLIMLRWKIGVYQGRYMLFSLTHGRIDLDPRPVDVRLPDLFAEFAKAAAWLGLALWMGWRLFG